MAVTCPLCASLCSSNFYTQQLGTRRLHFHHLCHITSINRSPFVQSGRPHHHTAKNAPVYALCTFQNTRGRGLSMKCATVLFTSHSHCSPKRRVKNNFMALLSSNTAIHLSMPAPSLLIRVAAPCPVHSLFMHMAAPCLCTLYICAYMPHMYSPYMSSHICHICHAIYTYIYTYIYAIPYMPHMHSPHTLSILSIYTM